MRVFSYVLHPVFILPEAGTSQSLLQSFPSPFDPYEFAMRFSAFLVNALAVTLASAHGSRDVKRDQAIRRSVLEHSKKDLSHCAAKIRRSGLEARNVQRRAEHAAALIEKRGIERRGLPSNLKGRFHTQYSRVSVAYVE